MRIHELTLAAFGPFTERVLNFDHAQGDLHIVYGPNEAGKSSALRGLKALLYGIQARTTDNFLHDNTNLRISGHLLAAAGHELRFTRRKGSKNTLLTLDGEPLDDQALLPFLNSVTQEIFETFFGIDHQALVQGGRDILEQKGEVGQTLFSAALGSHVLHSVLAQFDGEADTLFKSRGSKPVINQALAEYKQLQKEIREKSLSTRDWESQRRALDQVIVDLEHTQSELAQYRKDRSKLQRIQRILPKIARRKELLLELESMSGVLLLADDFTERRQYAQQELETAQAMLGQLVPRHENLQQQIDTLSVNRELLGQAERIEELHTRLGSHRKAQLDKPHLVAEHQQSVSEAELLLNDLQPDLNTSDMEGLRRVWARRYGIAETGAREAALLSAIEQTESSRRAIEFRLKTARMESRELPQAGSSAALRSAIVAARRQGDMDTLLQSIQGEQENLKSLCANALSRLTLWEGTLEQVTGLALPSRENINRVAEAYAELEKPVQRYRERLADAEEDLRDISQRLDENQRKGRVPTESDLLAARSVRDQIWHRLRRQYFDGEEIPGDAAKAYAAGSLPDEYEERLADTDKLSDRLRREADRVHEIASLQARQASVQGQSGEVTMRLQGSITDIQRLDAEWHALWAASGIQPATPKEMLVWLDDVERLRERIAALNELEHRVNQLYLSREKYINDLNQQLVALGKTPIESESVEYLLLECERIAEQLDATRQQHAMLEKEVKTLESDLLGLTARCTQAEETYGEWQTRWQILLDSLELRVDITPSEVSIIVDKLREYFDRKKEAQSLYQRIRSIDQDATVFLDQVANAVQSIAPGLVDAAVEDAVLGMNALLIENRSRKTQREQLDMQIVQASADIQATETNIREMQGRLDSLCEEARVDSHAKLDSAERQSARYAKTSERLATVEQDILDSGEGASIALLESETTGIDSDELPGRIDTLQHKIDAELEPRRTELAETRGRKEKELELMDGGDQVAELAERAQAVLADIRASSEHYVRVKLGGRILRNEIERYRRENQGPLVKRASEHLNALTLGSFETLMADIDDKDQPVLVGIRPDGERVHVAGMSSGTRDQLYLALRLASLEKYMLDAEPMPFIVDDILVDFDDQRTESALKQLAALAEKTQVILFTHHLQLVEQAKKLPGEGVAKIHDL